MTRASFPSWQYFDLKLRAFIFRSIINTERDMLTSIDGIGRRYVTCNLTSISVNDYTEWRRLSKCQPGGPRRMSDSEVLVSRNGISYSAKRVDLILAHFDDAKYFLHHQRKYERQSKAQRKHNYITEGTFRQYCSHYVSIERVRNSFGSEKRGECASSIHQSMSFVHG